MNQCKMKGCEALIENLDEWCDAHGSQRVRCFWRGCVNQTSRFLGHCAGHARLCDMQGCTTRVPVGVKFCMACTTGCDEVSTLGLQQCVIQSCQGKTTFIDKMCGLHPRCPKCGVSAYSTVEWHEKHAKMCASWEVESKFTCEGCKQRFDERHVHLHYDEIERCTVLCRLCLDAKLGRHCETCWRRCLVNEHGLCLACRCVTCGRLAKMSDNFGIRGKHCEACSMEKCVVCGALGEINDQDYCATCADAQLCDLCREECGSISDGDLWMCKGCSKEHVYDVMAKNMAAAVDEAAFAQRYTPRPTDLTEDEFQEVKSYYQKLLGKDIPEGVGERHWDKALLVAIRQRRSKKRKKVLVALAFATLGCLGALVAFGGKKSQVHLPSSKTLLIRQGGVLTYGGTGWVTSAR